MNRRSFCLSVGALLCAGGRASAEGALVDLYPRNRLIQETPRFERRVGDLFRILSTLIVRNDVESAHPESLQGVRLEFPPVDVNGSPLNFYSHRTSVTLPVLSLLFVEDICTAYAWLDAPVQTHCGIPRKPLPASARGPWRAAERD